VTRAREMTDYLRKILSHQFEAALCMLHDCIRKCPPEHWEGKIANDTFRQISYHTLFFFDYYLSPSEAAFVLRDLNLRGGDEPTNTDASKGLEREEALAYANICRQKMIQTLAGETAQSLQSVSGFSWLPFSRGELHLYNIRHVQHHAGQLSAYLRRIPVEDGPPWWVKTGWR
jgi:hypothetical protein